MCDFNIKLHQSEDLFKKLEDSVLKNIDRILKKTFFRGWDQRHLQLPSPPRGPVAETWLGVMGGGGKPSPHFKPLAVAKVGK